MQVLELTHGAKGPDTAVLASLVQAVERDIEAAGGAAAAATMETPEAREAERQAERVHSLLTATASASASSGAEPAEGAEVWGLQARLRRARGDALGAKECVARQLRALSTMPFDKDAEAWARYSSVLAASADDLLTTPSSSVAELSSARLTLRGAVKRGEDLFGDTEAHARLRELVVLVTEAEDRKREAAKAAAAAAAGFQ